MEQPQMVIPLMKMGLGMVTTNIYYLLTAIAFSINGIADMRNRRVYSYHHLRDTLLNFFDFNKLELCAQIRASSLAGGMPVW